MERAGDIVYEARIDDSEFRSGARSVENQAKDTGQNIDKNFTDKIRDMRPAFKKMAAVGTTAFAGISFAMGKAISAAGDAEKTQANFENTFGDSADVVGGFIQEFGDQFKFVETELMNGANSIGFQLNAMGDIGKEEGEKITESLLTAAGGLSDFFGNQMSVADASNALAKGLAGNRQQLMDMGFNVAVEDMKEYAESLGMNADELTKAQEAEIFTQMIMDQTKGSVSGLQDSMDTYTGQVRANQKAKQELSETIGATFLPMVTDILEKITPVIEKIGTWIEENPELARNIAIGAAAIAGLVAVVGLLGIALPAIITGFGLLLSPIGLIVAAVAGLIAIGIMWWKNWDTMKENAKKLWENIKETFKGAIDAVIGFFKGLWDGAIGWMEDLRASVRGRVSDIKNTLVNTIKSAISNVISFFKNLPRRIISALGNVGKMLFNSGKAIIQGLIDGIKNIGGAVKDAVGGVLSSARDLLPFSDAKEGPFSDLTESGESIFKTIAEGMRAGSRDFAFENILGSSGVASSIDTTTRAMVDPSESMTNNSRTTTNNINEINIGSELEGEEWLRRLGVELGREEEIREGGLS